MTNSNVSRSIASGTMWSFMMRWSIKLVGFINIIIIARLLTPEDFGLVALMTLAAGLVSVFIDFGIGASVIRENKIDDNFLNTAWTAKIIQGIFLSSILFIIAPYFASFYGKEELESIIKIYSLSFLFGGFSNIGVVLLRRDLNYEMDYIFEVVNKIVATGLTLILCFQLRNYWGIVYAYIASNLVRLVLSYLFSNYRPKIRFDGLMPFIKFSMYLVFINSGKYLGNRFTVVVGGKLLDSVSLGIYTMAENLAELFTHEILLPITRALFPHYAKLKTNMEELRETYLDVLKAVVYIILPITCGIIVCSEEVVLIILGSQWSDVFLFLPFLAAGFFVRAINWLFSGNIMIVTNNERSAAKCTWVSLVITSVVVFVMAYNYNIFGLVLSPVIANVIAFPLILFILSKAIDLNWKRALGAIGVASLPSLPILVAVPYLPVSEMPIIMSLLIKAFFGIVIYLFSLYLAWKLYGSRESVEFRLYKLVFEKVVSKIK